MAGGFSILESQIPSFCKFLNDLLTETIAHNPPILLIEGILNAAALTPELIHSLEMLGPFGAGHLLPRFVLKNMAIAKIDVPVSGQGKLCFRLQGVLRSACLGSLRIEL